MNNPTCALRASLLLTGFLFAVLSILLSASFASAQENGGMPPPAGQFQPMMGESREFQGPPPQGGMMEGQRFDPGFRGDFRPGEQMRPDGRGNMMPPRYEERRMDSGAGGGGGGERDPRQGGGFYEEMGGPRGGDPRGGEMEGGRDFDPNEELNRMKRQMKGMERGVGDMARALARIKKQGISVPSEYETTIAALQSAIATIKNATESSGEVEAAMDTIQEMGPEMGEIGPKIGMLEHLPRIMKEATRQVSQIKKMYAKSVARAQKAGIDVSDIKQSIESKLQEFEAAIAEAKASTDPEEAADSLREDVFEGLEDLRDEMMILENISNASKMLKDAEKEIVRIEKAAATLKKQKKDVSQLESLIAEMKALVADVKTLMQSKGSDKEQLFDAFYEGERLHNDALEILAKLRGEKTEIDKQFTPSDASKPNMGATVYWAVRDFLGF